ncbi:hypothetical protein FV218_11905 [Methylobacterium sp. WL69]|uniref:hypothetical protein n=1 Tax=Methylobacterium sp. WL69 TaxID=2603893 RepID=UPI0011CACA8A|nr:hypothetical protein [Methylobacterium sp. WL69]TXM73126.1 hypothetical protein FV218_11905 [Methylobacterium sp. WL69]
MREVTSAELVTEVHQRLSMIQRVIAPEHFRALAGAIMKEIGAAAMAEAERRSGLLHEPPPTSPKRCNVIRFPFVALSRGMGSRGTELEMAGAITEAPPEIGAEDDGSISTGGSHE